MRIAMISDVYHATPPTGYGGIERVVHRLTEQLIKEGHEVALFGAKGSYCSGETVEVSSYDPSKLPSGIRTSSDIVSEEDLYKKMFEYFENNAVDVIHDFSFQNLFVLRHPKRFPFVISTCVPPMPDYSRPNLVACSSAHAKLCGGKTRFVHYGLDLSKWEYQETKKDHLIHISKITSYKGQHLAIEAARKSKRKLVLAGNIEDKIYYYTRIKPALFMSSKDINYIGEVKGTKDSLKDAKALVQTPLWFDAFPLVILESLASGTPVISFNRGGIGEQIVDGVTGFLCETKEDLAEAMRNIDRIKPGDCRSYAEEHFSLKRMADQYVDLYEGVIKGNNW